ncbi:MAG TPA: TIGR04283 family arsenosugar biosynthesis glycosyltransferase [Nitrospirales bacterium]|nr:TIGR04283 family arsenosugar biosynthesis glycosyltransferase [Nitrospirales bacterium]
MGTPPSISVIIPTLNEAQRLPAMLEWTAAIGFSDILVVDGGSDDGTLDAAAAVPSVRCLLAPRGRARQMNAGAAAAAGDVLLFLHADTRLPMRAQHAIEDAFREPTVNRGFFAVRFEPPTVVGSVIAFMMNGRSFMTRIATGDQALFVRRSAFERVGGFPDIPLMEDVELSRRLKRWDGTCAVISDPVITSYRRWQQQGAIRTIVLMWTLRMLYWLGMSPQRLVRWYADVR